MPTDPCSESLFSQILGGNAITCNSTFQEKLASDERAQIQSVVDNAENAGYNDAVLAVAQQTADVQSAQADADASGITGFISRSKAGLILNGSCNGEPGVDLSLVGGPCMTYTLLKEIGLGILLALIVGVILYGTAVLGPFIPKGRR